MTDESQNPPLPLDLDVPFNDDFSVTNSNTNNMPSSNINMNNIRNPILNRKNILVNSYNPNSDFNLRNQHTTNRNILINNFDSNNKNSTNSNNSDEVNLNNINNNNNNNKDNNTEIRSYRPQPAHHTFFSSFFYINSKNGKISNICQWVCVCV